MRLYLDTAPIIYLVEKHVTFGPMVRQRLRQTVVTVFTSELVRLECRVKPLRNGDVALLQNFDDFLEDRGLKRITLDRPVLERATELRARYAFLKTPDAIHLAAALVANCDVFLTNDRRLDRCGGEITVETLAA